MIIYHIHVPINVISLDTVDFTLCDPMLRITTLSFLLISQGVIRCSGSPH